jgi:excisionase family DNA binding protein
MQLEERLEQIKSLKRADRKKKPGKELKEPIQRPDQDPEGYYTSYELAKLFGKSQRRVQEWAKSGIVPADKNGSHYRFPKAGINEFLKGR